MPSTPVVPDRPRQASSRVLSTPDMKHPAWAAWQAYVDAGRIGRRLEASDDIRVIHAANERLICGDGIFPIW